MREEILSAAAKRKLFFTPDAMEMILSNDHPMEFTNTVFSHLADNVMFVSKKDIMDCIAGDKILFESPKEIVPHNKFTPDIHVIKGTDITGESTCEGKINDFAQYFRARFFTLKRLVEKRNDFGKAMDISRAKTLDRDVKIVGIVYEKSTTKNGHTMLTIEDDTDTIKVFISRDSPLASESWLKANSVKDDINYIVFPGDVVDGIGVFPDQDKELIINDIDDQYAKLAEYLKDIPDHIKMIIHPGNHDACRLAEPQPALNQRFTKGFDSNILMVGNPIYLDIEGRTVLTYHGKSMDDWIAAVQNLTYDNPLSVMKQMCVRRHLAPIYGQRNALAPEKKDYMCMELVPDIFVSGHVHGAGQEIYNGVRLINASTWQSQTEYQRQHNFNPDPGIMPVVELGSGRIRMHNFHEEA